MTTQGDQRCHNHTEGYCFACSGKPNQRARNEPHDEARDGCVSWAARRSSPAECDDRKKKRFPQTAVSGIFSTGPGAPGTGEVVGWKLARRQANADSDRTDTKGPAAGTASVVENNSKNGQLAVSCENRCVMNSYASSQCHVGSQVVRTDSGRRSLASFSLRTSSSHQLSDISTQGLSQPARCRETEGVTSKPYAHVLPQGQTLDTGVYSVSSCNATQDSHVLTGAGLPMSEAAFAEHIACSSIGFQPESFRKYWNDSCRGDDEGGKWISATDTCLAGSADSSSASMILKSLQHPEDSNSSTPSLTAARACTDFRSPRREGCADGTTQESFNRQSGSTVREDGLQDDQTVPKSGADCGQPAGYNPKNLLGPDPFHSLVNQSADGQGKQAEGKQTDGAGQAPHDWIPLSTFTLYNPHSNAIPDLPPADCSKESRLVQCYSVNVAASTDGQHSPQKQTPEYGVVENAAAVGENASRKSSTVDDSQLSAGVEQGSGGEVPGVGAVGAGGGGPKESGAVSGSSRTEATVSSTEGGRKTGSKDRILEEISAWFSDNAG